MNNRIAANGKTISVDDLTNAYAIELIEAIRLNPFAELIEIRRDSESNERITVELEIEIPQIPKHDIRKKEDLEIVFAKDNDILPRIFSLRLDFPLVPHLYSRESEFPRWLCLYEKTFEELQLTWSSFEFLERIREWLMLTSKGKLHAADQPLEPFIFHSTTSIVLPRNLFKRSIDDIICFEQVSSGNYTTYLSELTKDLSRINTKKDFLTIIVFGKPQPHGVISSIPKTIKELDILLRSSEVSLIEELRKKLLSWNEMIKDKNVFESGLIIIVALPKQREVGSKVEDIETKVFLLKQSIVEIGTDIGIWQKQDGKLGQILFYDKNKDGQNLSIESLNSIDPFTEESARLYNNNPLQNIKIAAVGVGALGSQIYNNLLRQGMSNWILVDSDIFFPHNLARHTLGTSDLGKHKVLALKNQAYKLFGNDNLIAAYTTDILKEKDNLKLNEEIKNSDLILDISASIPVARLIALDIISNARRLSIFTNPKGNELVIFIEDEKRSIPLDVLEMQYYRELLNNQKLSTHLMQPSDRLRYGNSCRDISSRRSIENIAVFGGLSTIAIKQIQKQPTASIQIWQMKETGDAERIIVQTSQCFKKNIGDWILVFDALFISKIYELRNKKLPNETGGVLLGSYDSKRKMIYVVDTIPSPTDSREWPTVYVRGIKGLNTQLEKVKKLTASMLTYVGEWHSHPHHCSSNPSLDDIEAFKWLTEVLNENGKPSLMLIVGDEYAFYLGKMERF